MARRVYCLRRFRDLIGDMAETAGGCPAAAAEQDHFVPWARYPLDLGHNYVLADTRRNGFNSDRLAAFDHLDRWCARNDEGQWTAALAERLLPHDPARTRRVAAWAYGQVERSRATVWQEGRDGLVALDGRWARLLV